MMNQSKHRYALTGIVLIAVMLLFISACGDQKLVQPAVPAQPDQQPSSPVSQTPELSACKTKDCFILLANDCKDADIIVNEEAGVFKYSSKGCVFTKTLVTPSEQETSEIKNLLQGKSLTCKYEKGDFDQRWTTSLVFGIEKCDGELKEILVELLAFTS